MKPMKKNSTSQIKTYFKVAPKQFVCEDKINNNVIQSDTNEAVYLQKLKDKLKNFEGEDAPSQSDAIIEGEGASGYDMNVKGNLLLSDAVEVVQTVAETAPECLECIKKTAEAMESDAKHKALKKFYYTLTSAYSELSIKYEALLSAKKHIDQLDIGVKTAMTDDLFTKNELKFLQCMPLNKKKDSTFILQCIEFTYKNNLSVLRNKTLKGTSESVMISEEGAVKNTPAKDPLTPVKVVRIKELFLERLSKCDIDSAVYTERAMDSNMNKLIATGIKNIAKKQKAFIPKI